MLKQDALNLLNSLDAIRKEYAANPDLYVPYGYNDAERTVLETIKTLYPDYVNDKEVSQQILNLSGYISSWEVDKLSNDLKADKDVILTAIKQNEYSFKSADASLQDDKEFLLEATAINGHVLAHASSRLQADKDVALSAVSTTGLALGHVDYSLRNDKDVVLAAVKQDGFALQFASENLCKDREVVLTAVSKNYLALQYADNKLKADKEIVLNGIKDIIKRHERMQGTQTDDFFKNCVSRKLRNDPEFMIEAIKVHSTSYVYAFNTVKENKDVFIAYCENALTQHGNGRYSIDIPDSLSNDKDAVLAAVKLDGYMVKTLPQFQDDKEVVMAAAETYGYAIDYASDRLKNDKETVLHFINNSQYRILQYTSDKMRDDVDVVRAAVRKDPESMKYASERIQKNPGLLEEKKSLKDIIGSATSRASGHTNIQTTPNKNKDR